MPTWAVASKVKVKVELANFGIRLERANRPAWQHPWEVFNRLEDVSEPVRFAAIGKMSDGRSLVPRPSASCVCIAYRPLNPCQIAGRRPGTTPTSFTS